MNGDILYTTDSLCPVCLKRIPARYLRKDSKVYFYKECPEHGPFSVFFWDDADLYEEWLKQSIRAPAVKNGKPKKDGCPFDCGLCEEHHSGTCTVILEITYRCNMDCRICFADANRNRFDPDLDTIRRMYGTALRANRFCSVQLSGGEPTVRDDLPEIIRMGKELGVIHLQVNTNGLRIAQDLPYLQKLKDAGVDLIYLQFDCTDDEIYRAIRGREMMEIKKQAIANCEALGIGVLLVPVVIPELNLHRLGEIIAFAKSHIPTVKGVHFQPLSFFGRYPDQAPPDECRCGLSDVLHALDEQCGGELKMEHFVPRKQFDSHCDFSSSYYLDEDGKLIAISDKTQNCDDTEKTDFVAKTNRYTDKRWRFQPEGYSDKPLIRFAMRTMTHSFSVSGKGFQDVWNIDLGRLRGCCVHAVTDRGELVPFCAFHLTSANGKRLYENGEEIL